jgi:hypothetical protein
VTTDRATRQKAKRCRTAKPPRRNARTAARPTRASIAGLKKKNTLLARELTEAREQQAATSRELSEFLERSGRRLDHRVRYVTAPRRAPIDDARRDNSHQSAAMLINCSAAMYSWRRLSRATFFHLGVIKLLRDARLLQQVTHISSVSGGSILAAHAVLNWEKYIGTEEEFRAAESDLVRLGSRDIRGRVVRRWILACLSVWGLVSIGSTPLSSCCRAS